MPAGTDGAGTASRSKLAGTGCAVGPVGRWATHKAHADCIDSKYVRANGDEPTSGWAHNPANRSRDRRVV
jgi:hypothetical protein